eukprot:NODE_948_length_1357_cov_215.931957_g790_i0.p1 GENE.NODE_948_length_1357_cov_215.931957_g790_i0~~NODE_948_length_1357_cov_215.931957_g790_i0.p1  ORF type:complete len:397 (+),score=80.71 NODE_948_length_1357_cov_215.931957_g790_i0:170-1192(+)
MSTSKTINSHKEKEEDIGSREESWKEEDTSSVTSSEDSDDSDASSVNLQGVTMGCWEAKKKLTSGNNGQVYISQLAGSPEVRVALKVETRSLRHSQMGNEVKVMRQLREEVGFPRVVDTGIQNDRRWMVMDLLGPSLRNLYDRYSFDEDLVVVLAEQMITRLEVLHSKGFVHLSVKPDNFCLQQDSEGRPSVYLIDFGRCDKYIKDGKHIEPGKNKGGPFSRWYHSANALQGKLQSRGDDMQSLAYTLTYFFKGDKFADWREDQDTPWTADVAGHYKDSLPEWLVSFLNHATSLKFDQKPDYDLVRNLLKSKFTKEGTEEVTHFLKHAVRRHFERKCETR